MEGIAATPHYAVAENNIPPYFTALAPFETLFRQGSAILTYHSVSPRPRGARMRGNYLHPRLFSSQLAQLKEAGFRSVPLESPEAGGVALTFDDGYLSVFENALPILEKYGYRGIVFIVSGELGGINRWDIPKGEGERALMGETQIREWLKHGHEIGGHTFSHPDLSGLPAAAARDEIAGSRKKLEDTFGVPVKHFCYPYGSYDASILKIVQEAGYSSAVTTQFGINSPDTPRFELRRIPARHRSFRLRNLLGL